MAKRKKSARLSAGELRLMGLLWERGPLTLSETFEAQPGHVGYTTIQTQLNRLVDKRVASRSKSRPMKYRALIEPETAGAGLLQLLIETIGHGSILPLVEQLLACTTLSNDDVRELKRMIEHAKPKVASKRTRPPVKKAKKARASG